MISRIIFSTLLITVTCYDTWNISPDNDREVILTRRIKESQHSEDVPPGIPRPISDVKSDNLPTGAAAADMEIPTYLNLVYNEASKLYDFNGSVDGVLLLGNAQSLKSSLAQVISANVSQLEMRSVNHGERKDLNILNAQNESNPQVTEQLLRLIPQPVRDYANNLTYFIFPDYNQTQSPSEDIAARFLIEKVAATLNSVRVILVVPESDVTGGKTDAGFDSLLESVEKTLLDFGDFSDVGIGMIVADIVNYDEIGQFRNDSKVLGFVTSFLKQYARKLKWSGKRERKAELAINFYTEDAKKVALIRNPTLRNLSSSGRNENGGPSQYHILLQGVPALQWLGPPVKSNRERIFQLVMQTLSPINMQSHSSDRQLGATPSEAALRRIRRDINEHRPSSFPNLNAPDTVWPQFATLYERTLGHSLNGTITKTNFSPNISWWVEPSRNLSSSRPSARIEWFDFLSNITHVLSSYNFHSKKPPSQPQNIRELVAALPDSNKSMITPFVMELLEQSTHQVNPVVTKEETQLLWELVREAFEKPKFSDCSKSSDGVTTTMTVSGTFIKASDFTNPDGSFIRCPTGGGITPNGIKLFATQTVFLDRNISPSKQKYSELAIVSPIVEVVVPAGSASILVDFSGLNAHILWQFRTVYHNLIDDSHYTRPSIPQYIEIECQKFDPMSNKEGTRGLDGRPGNHGMPGGNFIVISEKIVNGDKLIVSVRGGKGGNGEDGTDGGDGKMGAFFPFSKWKKAESYWIANAPCMCDVYRDHWQNSHDDCWTTSEEYGLFFSRCVVLCNTFGCPGGVGGDGGDGGAPGKGGRGGNLQILSLILGSSGVPKTFLGDGGDGATGKGGQPGIGGDRNNGDSGRLEQRMTFFDDAYGWKNLGTTTSHRPEMRSPFGSRGSDGGNKKGQRYPPANQKFNLNPPNLVLNYLKFTINIPSPTLTNFFQLIDTSEEITRTYTPLDFAEELLFLEETHLEMRNNRSTREDLTLKLLPHYDSLTHRLDTYFNKINTTIYAEDKKLLSLVYSTAVNQANTLRQVFGVTVVVDVKGYMKAVHRRLDQYSQTETKNIIDDERDRYKETFIKKIQETQFFIQNTVDPAIKESTTNMAQSRKGLEEQVKRAIENAERAGKEYKKAIDAATKSMKINLIFNILEKGATALALLGPEGAVAGAIVGGGTSIAKSIVISPETPTAHPLTKLPESVRRYAKSFDERKEPLSKNRINRIRFLITQVEKFYQDYNGYLEKIPIKELKDNFNQLVESGRSGNITWFRKVDETVAKCELKIHQFLNSTFNKLQDKLGIGGDGNGTESGGLQKALKSLKRLKDNLVTVANLGYEVFEAYKDDQAKIDKLNEMVREAARHVRALQDYEETIKGELVPKMNELISDLSSAEDSLKVGSAVSIRVQEWKVGKMLRQYNSILKDITEGFPDIAAQFSSEIENIQYGMKLMIDLYSFIEKYQEQMKFADYIANINSPDALRISMGPENAKAYNKIERAMEGSLLIQEWDKLSATFLQWVFPFGIEFKDKTDNTRVPNYLNDSNSDTYNFLLPFIRKKVEDIGITIRELKSGIDTSADSHRITNDFNSDHVSLLPFYVWESETHNETIQKLFSGQTVTLVAPPNWAYRNKMATVKFTIAEIEPKARDPTIQAQLKEMLKNLKVEMTHSGISGYIYENVDYEMVGEKLTIIYNFERNGNGSRYATNNVYRKLEQGDTILSPYTHWVVRLKPARNDFSFDFSLLRQIAPLVDLELKGRGSYVEISDDLAVVTSVKSIKPLPISYRSFQVNDELFSEESKFDAYNKRPSIRSIHRSGRGTQEYRFWKFVFEFMDSYAGTDLENQFEYEIDLNILIGRTRGIIEWHHIRDLHLNTRGTDAYFQAIETMQDGLRSMWNEPNHYMLQSDWDIIREATDSVVTYRRENLRHDGGRMEIHRRILARWVQFQTALREWEF